MSQQNGHYSVRFTDSSPEYCYECGFPGGLRGVQSVQWPCIVGELEEAAQKSKDFIGICSKRLSDAIYGDDAKVHLSLAAATDAACALLRAAREATPAEPGA